MAASTDLTLPPWDTEQIFLLGSEWFAGYLADIENAKHSICLQTYIFEIGGIGERVLKALCAASARGVRVQVIVDGFGSSADLHALQDILEANGIDCYVYHPMPWQLFLVRTEHGSWVHRLLLRVQQFNNRQHSKLLLVDDNIAWVGSFNITDKHLLVSPDGSNRKDCGARVTGARCLLLRDFFRAILDGDADKQTVVLIRHSLLSPAPLLRKQRLRYLLEQIHHSRERIWITSGYFAPIKSVLRALKKARQRGVDVRIIVPTKSDIGFFPALTSTYYADLLRAGIDVYAYLPSILHAKSMIIDNSVKIGSSNFNHRSLLHDIELDIELFSDNSRREIEQDFIDTLPHCRKISPDNFTRRYAGLLVLGQIPRLLRYWL